MAAVIVDLDLNINYVNLQKGVSYLQKPEVEFLCGARDEKNTFGKKNHFVLGPGHFVKILENATGRNAIGMAKRSRCMNEYLMEKFQMGKDPSRVLLIGDS